MLAIGCDMSFDSIKASSRARFDHVRVHLEFIESLEPKSNTDEHSIQVKILRGLFYVHLYSALEKTAIESVEHALLLIGSQRVQYCHYQHRFGVVSLYAEMQAFKDAGPRSFFEKSLEVFSSLGSSDVSKPDNAMFSARLQNVRYKTLNEVFRCFGMDGFSVDPRLRLSVDEVVEKRNAVAHGRESAIHVGERHRSDILRSRNQDIQLVTDKFIDGLEACVVGLEHIMPIHRGGYTCLPTS